MNAQSNAAPEAPDSQKIAPATTSEIQLMYWSVRRELWENRFVYIAPLTVAAVALFGFLIATIGRALAISNLAQRRAVLEEPYTFVTGLIMATAFVAGMIYCLEALHSERRDRSILFWKSLPVSDLTTVLSKLAIALIVLPLFSFAIVVVTQVIMLLLSSMVLMGNGLGVAMLWTRLFHTLLMLFYHLMTVHVFWYAPIYAWLMLVSGWARRAAFLWAALPVLAIGVIEKLAFNTSHFAALLKYRFTGPEAFDFAGGSSAPIASMSHRSLGEFFISPGLWIGLAAAVALLAAAVRLRRYQGPI